LFVFWYHSPNVLETQRIYRLRYAKDSNALLNLSLIN
jgi:hypothetical protein